MSVHPPSVIRFVAALDNFFAEEVPCSCAIEAASGIPCDFHWFVGEFNRLPGDLKQLAAAYRELDASYQGVGEAEA